MKIKILLIAGGALLASGCSSTGSSGSAIIPNKAIQLTAKTSISLANLATTAVVAAAIYVVYDPLAPNWEIEEARLNDDTYRFSLKMKRYAPSYTLDVRGRAGIRQLSDRRVHRRDRLSNDRRAPRC